MNNTRTRWLRITDLVLIATLLASGSVAAHNHNTDGPRSTNALRELRVAEDERHAAIETEIALNGPLSPALYELYFALATHYSERDDYVLAAEAFEQARHIQRVTRGLFSLEQVAATRQLIAVSLAAGQPERAANLDIELMRIARQNLDDVRSADILMEAAERQAGVYRRYLAGELPPQISININSGPPRAYADPNRLLGEANRNLSRRNWTTAINVLLRAGQVTDDRIVELEHKLIESYYLEATGDSDRRRHRNDEKMRRETIFLLGKASYERLLALAVRVNDYEAAAGPMIGLADWHLLFHKNSTALDLYKGAYDALTQMGASETLLRTVFNPDVPVVLPAFDPSPLARRTSIGSSETETPLTITMRMNRWGRSRLRNLSVTPLPEEAATEREIRQIVARSRFRPYLINGEAPDAVELEFRYYVDSGT